MIKIFDTEVGREPRRATERVENTLRAKCIHSASVALCGPRPSSVLNLLLAKRPV
jgi:hypothetical protein